MKYIATGLLSLFVVGCANVGTMQSACNKTTSTFPDMVRCVDDAIAQDGRMSRNPRIELYRLRAAQLARRVEQKQIDDLDARVELQQLHVKLRSDELAEINSDDGLIPQMKSTVRTNCTTYGSNTSCTSR